MNVTYQPDLSGMRRFIALAENALANPSVEPIASGFRQAAALYLGFTRRRFVENSRGGGEWPDLAYSTKLARARGTKAGRTRMRRAVKKSGGTTGSVIAGMRFPILRDTGTLLNSLSQGAPGAVENFVDNGVSIGTAVSYSIHHQNPSRPGRPPQRRIFVDPDDSTSSRMKQVIGDAVIAALRAIKP